MITLEWLKEVAENLRLGLYKSEILEFSQDKVKLKNINANIGLHISVEFECEKYDTHYSRNIFGQCKKTSESKHWKERLVYCGTGPLNSKNGEDWEEEFIWLPETDSNYQFWSEFREWIIQHSRDNKMRTELKAMEAFTV